jgi:hypothetical protein
MCPCEAELLAENFSQLVYMVPIVQRASKHEGHLGHLILCQSCTNLMHHGRWKHMQSACLCMQS